MITSSAKKIIAPINEGPMVGKNEANEPINSPQMFIIYLIENRTIGSLKVWLLACNVAR